MSTLFTVATKAYDNFVNPQGEDKYNSTGRKVAETITESAVDIAVDAGIKAGVTVAATALLELHLLVGRQSVSVLLQSV